MGEDVGGGRAYAHASRRARLAGAAVAGLALLVGVRVDSGASIGPASGAGDRLTDAGLARSTLAAGTLPAQPPADGVRVLGWGPAPPAATLPAATPLVGADLEPQTSTCAGSRSGPTARQPADCVSWVASGPVNLVVIRARPATDADPATAILHGGWRPALGSWLVARGGAERGPAGCVAGDHASSTQAEHRLDAVSRRHVKFIELSCASARVVIADVHTDRWTRACRGDAAVDWDQARDDFVAALEATGRVAEVAYMPAPGRRTSYPGGCARDVVTDGRVAYVVMGPAPAG